MSIGKGGKIYNNGKLFADCYTFNIDIDWGKQDMNPNIKTKAFRLEDATQERRNLDKEIEQLSRELGQSCGDNTVVVGESYCLLIRNTSSRATVQRCEKVI